MTYSKPEVVVLGEAVEVIQGSKPGNPGDFGLTATNAYDLDE